MDLLASVRNIIDASVAWIQKVQNPDGGLPSDKEGSISCTWTTSGLLWVSWSAGVSFHEFYMCKALGWVLGNRNPDHGIPIVVRGDHSITDATAQTTIACSLALTDIEDEFFRSGLEGCVRWLLYHRLGNTGWNWRSSTESSWIASTAFAILGLHYSGRILSDVQGEIADSVAGALQWLRSLRNADGGWGAYEGDRSRPAVTALVCSVLSEVDPEFDCSQSIDFILKEQLPDGSWSDTIDRPTGHTVTRIGTPYCMRALADCGHPLDSRECQSAMSALIRSFDHGRFRYRDTDILSWPTRDHLLALTSIGRRLGLANCRTIAAKQREQKVPWDASSVRVLKPTIGEGISQASIFRLVLRLETDGSTSASCFETPLGEATLSMQLPFTFDELTTVLKTLDMREYDPNMFTTDQTLFLADLGVLDIVSQRLRPNLLQTIGVLLYESVFRGDIGDAFRMAFNQSRRLRKPLHLQLRFSENAGSLARYPWELLYDGRRHLVSGGAVELTRYISYPEAPTPLSLSHPLRILVVTSRPLNLIFLPTDDEWVAIENALQAYIRRGDVIVDRLRHATYDSLREKLEETEYQVLHLDGHGVFARRCPVCGEMHYPHYRNCLKCNATMEAVPPTGLFAFEDNQRNADFVDSAAIQNLVIVSKVCLAVVSACQTSSLREGSVFGGFGPGLIQAGIPAIVAMQLSVSADSIAKFVSSFYGGFTKEFSLPGAVAAGRKALFRQDEWYIPTLWLRS